MNEMRHDHDGEALEPGLQEILGSLRNAAPPPDARERIVQGAMRRVGRRSLFGHGFELALAASAAAVAIGVGLHLWGRGGPDQTIPSGGSLHVAGDLPTSFKVYAHEVHLSPESQVEVVAAEAGRIELAVKAGRATFAVEKLREGEVFRVRTAHVLVEVVGTRFAVQSESHCSTVTVEEGLVRVSDTAGAVVYLRPNQQRRFCPDARNDALLRQALVLISEGGALDEAIGLLEKYLSSNPSSALEEEALYHLCLAHARLGHEEKARELAREFRHKFPESARLERLERGLAHLREGPAR